MIEVKPNQIYTIDIDGTVCDSSKEFARWGEYCASSQCVQYRPASSDNQAPWCVLGKNLCEREADVAAQGIFSAKALVNLPVYSQARGFLQAIEKEPTSVGYFVTGRPERQREATVDWMERNKLPIFYMLMREESNRGEILGIKREMIRRLYLVYGEPKQTWYSIDDDGGMEEMCEGLGVTFIKAPECWE